jgi:glycosyltransferase involved in cell wall biosynthesis
MKIGFDISMLVYQGSGVATHTYNLVKHLLLFDKENEYRLFYSSFRRPQNFYYLKELRALGAKIYDYPFPPKVLKFWWNTYEIVPVELFIGKVDVFHSSDFLRPPLLKGTTGITTIHDVTWKIFPEYHTKEIIEAHDRKMIRTIKGKDIIIVDSENTKKDLLKYYPEVKGNNQIFTIYLGVDEKFQPIHDQKKITNILKTYDVDSSKRYLLYVGAIEPRKNLDMVIKVFSELIKDKEFADFEFLIVGRAGWKNEKIFQLVKELRLTKKIHFVGFVTDADLPYFYSAAQIFVYLSKYEGFGLPPLEAFACGTKVIASNNSSLKEVIDAEYLCDENDKNKILEKLKYIVSLPKSKIGENKYTWTNTAQNFLRLLHEIR